MWLFRYPRSACGGKLKLNKNGWFDITKETRIIVQERDGRNLEREGKGRGGEVWREEGRGGEGKEGEGWRELKVK